MTELDTLINRHNLEGFFFFNSFLPDDGDVRDGTPEGRTILLGGFSPLALPDVLMAPCLSMAGGGPIEDEGLGLPHHLTRSQYDKQELAKRKEECILNKNKYKKMTVTIKRTLKMLHPD